MIPVLFRFPPWVPLLGDQPITSFGAALLLAFLVAGTLFVRRLHRLEPDAAGWELVVTAAIVGLTGAKALHLGVHAALGLPSGGFGRGGLDWIGGLLAGGAAVLWHARRQGLAPGHVAGAAAAPLALGYAIGRVGSFLVGADYGPPTGLPWGVAFREGVPPTTPLNLREIFGATVPQAALVGDFARVHPTQLYEAALSLGIFAALGRRERGWSTLPGKASRARGWRHAGLFLILAGGARALAELVRLKQDRLVGPVTADLLLALGLVGVGLALRARTPAPRSREVA